MVTKQDLRAYRLEKQQEEQRRKSELAAQKAIVPKAILTTIAALGLAGCVSFGIGYQTKTPILKPLEDLPELSENYTAITELNYDQTRENPKVRIASSKRPAERNTPSSLDSMLAIRDDMPIEDVMAIIEIEKLREQNYRLNLKQLQGYPNQTTRAQTTTLKGKFAKYNAYSQIVENEVKKYNQKFHFPKPLTANHIYAMIEVESGNHPDAFKKDPMQIANQGDPALKILRAKGEYTWQIGDFSFLTEKKHTRIMDWLKHYSESNMDAESSIKGGIGWLINKAAIRDNTGNIIGWRSWEEAARRYNGGGVFNYTERVEKNLDKLAKL